MADALSNLKAAILRLHAEMRRRRKKKQRPQRPGGPRPSGPNANKGCGTGAGGFGKGNSCAKEDGIPNAPNRPAVMGPVNAKADLAKAKAMKQKAAQKQASKIAAAKAKSEAYKKSPEYAKKQKQKQIDSLRRKAAERKAAKGERDAAERKAAAEAAAKKRSELLQKIRIKKANERLNVIEKPPSVFSGGGDNTISQRPGEIKTEFLKRKYQKDLDTYHAEADRIEAKYEKQLSEATKERDDAYSAYRTNGPAHYDKYDAAKSRVEEIQSKRDKELHDLVGEFTLAHAGALARTQSLESSSSVFTASLPGTSNRNADIAKEEVVKAWQWLSRVAARKHEDRILGATITLRPGGGGSHNAMDGKNEITVGVDDDRIGTRKTTVHEYGHAIESANADTMRALTEDYRARAAEFIAANKGARLKGIGAATHYEAIYKAGEKVSDFNLQAPSYLGYARRYSDAGFKESTVARYKNHPDSARIDKGTEVFSTGIESVYKEPSTFRRRARHGFDLTLLILSGRL